MFNKVIYECLLNYKWVGTGKFTSMSSVGFKSQLIDSKIIEKR